MPRRSRASFAILMASVAFAAPLLEERYPKDKEAQKRAAELYLGLGLFERAEARLAAAGVEPRARDEAVLAAARRQGLRCGEYLIRESRKGLASGNYAQALLDSALSTWMNLASQYLKGMGR